MAEYEKYQELQVKTSELQAQWERQMRDMQLAKDQALHELTTHFEARLKEKQTEHEKVNYIFIFNLHSSASTRNANTLQRIRG